MIRAILAIAIVFVLVFLSDRLNNVIWRLLRRIN
jgi:hypothetical protein